MEGIMSSGLSILIIVILIAIIAVIATVVILNKYFNHQIAELDALTDELKDISVEEDIKRLEKMELAGKSLETFKRWQKVYQKVDTKDVGELKHLLEQAAGLNTKFNLIKTRQLIKEATELLQTNQDNVEHSKQVFTNLLEANRDNQKHYAALSKDYQQLRKKILSQSFNYGNAIDQIEEDLATLESDFQTVKNLSGEGDHEEAKKVLVKIDTNLTTLKTDLPKVENFDQELKNVFPDQLNELSNTYRQMIKDKYKITEVDVLEEIKSLRELVDSTNNSLTKLELKKVEKNNKEISTRIDSLYDILTKEFKARPFVDKNQDKIVQILSHVGNASNQLVAKLEHVDQSYELTHGELAEARQLKSQVSRMNSDFDVDCQKLADGDGVYSQIENKWLTMLDNLKEIEKTEKKLSNDIDGLFDAEKIANDSIIHFKQEISLVYRKVERRQLPGKPESFIQMYTLVLNEVKHTDNELNQVRINMEKISSELIQIQEDIERLKKEADEILNSADLVELTMQYSNKYLSNPEIKRARKEAYDLYQNKYEYKEALDVIATALEKVEPGSYQRIEKEYYSEQEADEEE